MKKVFCLFAVLAIVANFSFGQIIVPSDNIAVSNVQIDRMIRENAWRNNLRNPDRVYPGNLLRYKDPVKDSIWYWWVNKGDCQWTAVKNLLVQNQQHEPEKVYIPGDEDQNPASVNFSEFWQKNWPWLLIVLLFIALYIMALSNKNFRDAMNRDLFRKRDVKFSSDPTREGEPFVPTGIRNEDEAERHFSNLALISNPRLNPSNIVISDKKRVYVSTPNGESAVVEFANKTKKSLCFRNVAGWTAMVSTNGGKSFKREVFFQDCGNPVYNRTSMSDKGLIITDTPINFGGETMNQTTKTATVDVVKESDLEKAQKAEEKRQENEEVVKIQTNESTKIISDCLGLVSNTFLEKQHAHEVVIEFFNPENGVQVAKATLKTKNTNEPKKDEAK